MQFVSAQHLRAGRADLGYWGVRQRSRPGKPDGFLHYGTAHRAVLVMRDVEEMSTEEAAEALDLSPENVKIRLHRARAMVRRELFNRAGATNAEVLQFHARRCDRVVRAVMTRIASAAELPPL